METPAPSTRRSAAQMAAGVAETMLGWRGYALVECTEIQTLWAGYGCVCEVRARPRISSDVSAKTGGRGGGGGRVDGIRRLILKLVKPPLRRGDEDEDEDEGHLATRREEYAGLAADADSEWSDALCRPFPLPSSSASSSSSVAELVADFLTPRGDRPYESYIHGDVKSENLFAAATGSRVAFFDFQYVGLGLGVCDLAKLFTCSVPLRLLTLAHGDGAGAETEAPRELGMGAGERRLLEHYRRRLLEIAGVGYEYEWDLLVRHWEAALVDWLRFQMSWGAWGNTEWLQARGRSILRDDGFRKWLLENTG